MSVSNKIKSDKLLFLKTCVMCMVFVVIGWGISLVGPTLLDLQISVQASLRDTAMVVPARAVGYALGSLAGGLVPKGVSIETVIFVCVIATSVCFAVAPWCRALYQLVIALALSGFFMGAMEVSSSVHTFSMWGKDAAFIIQVVYLFFGVGALAAPLVAEPFLLKNEKEVPINVSVTAIPLDQIHVHFPYEILACFALLTAALFAVTSHAYKRNKGRSEADEEEDVKKVSRVTSLGVLGLATLVLHLYFGLEVAFGSMLETYLVKGPAQWTKSQAAFATSVFWGTYTFFRIITVVGLNAVGILRFLVIQFTLVVIGNAVLLTNSTGSVYLWVGISLLGTGLSSVFGLILAYLRQYLKITSKVMSTFLIAACIGEFIYPMLIATYIDQDPGIFLLITAACTGLMCLLFACLTVVCKILF